MTQQGDEWTGNWVADKIKTHPDVEAVAVLSPQHVELIRRQYSTIVVGTTAVSRFDATILNPFLVGTPAVSFVVNIPKEAYITGDALHLGARHNIPIGGFGDLERAVSLPDVSRYVSKEFSFVERGLAQHSRVEGFCRLDDRRYLLRRYGLSNIMVVVLNEYELTADHIRTARERYGAFNMAIITNPNGKATISAGIAAASMNAQIYKWRDFMGALHRE